MKRDNTRPHDSADLFSPLFREVRKLMENGVTAQSLADRLSEVITSIDRDLKRLRIERQAKRRKLA